MSHTNYNNVSNKTKPNATNVAPAVQPEPATTTPVTQPETTSVTPTTVETPTQPEAIFGTVCDCKNLNIRKNPDANSQILFAVPKDAKVKIDLDSSTAEWYKVFVNDQEGFCMKKFITLPQ